MGIYHINDLLKDDGSFCILHEFQDKHRQNSHFLEYNGLIYAIPQKWKNEIVGIQKLEYITDKSVTLLSYCVKLCKPAYKLFFENVFQHLKKSQKLRTTISQDDWTIVYSLIHYLIKNFKRFRIKLI